MLIRSNKASGWAITNLQDGFNFCITIIRLPKNLQKNIKWVSWREKKPRNYFEKRAIVMNEFEIF